MPEPALPEEVQGFGILGRGLRAVRAFALRSRIREILVERLPPGIPPPNSAEIIDRPSGTTVKLKLSSGGAGSNFQYPFQLIDASDHDGAKVRVRVGYLTDFINAPFLPSGMAAEDDPPFVIAASSGNHIWIVVTYEDDDTDPDYGEITSVAISSGASVPSPSSGTQYIDLGTVTVDSGAATPHQTAGGSFGFQICGASAIYWSLGLVA